MYATDPTKFKKFLREYCSSMGLTVPYYDERTKLRQKYAEFLKTAYVDDDNCSLMDFLDKNLLKTPEDLYKAKAALEKANVPEPYFVLSGSMSNTFSFQAPVPKKVGCAGVMKKPCGPDLVIYDDLIPCCKSNQEVENTMNYNEIEATRKYLNGRLNDARRKIEGDLTKQFRLNNPQSPRTYSELIDAIKNDQYTIDKKTSTKVDDFIENDGYWYGSAFDGIKWNLSNGPDYPGYEIAEKAMQVARRKAEGVVMTSDGPTGLKAVEDFEAWTYTPPTAATSAS